MLEYERNGRLAEQGAPWCSFLEVIIHDSLEFSIDLSVCIIVSSPSPVLCKLATSKLCSA